MPKWRDAWGIERKDTWAIGEQLADHLGLACWQCMPVSSFEDMFGDDCTVYEFTPYTKDVERLLPVLTALGIAFKKKEGNSQLALIYLNPSDVEAAVNSFQA